MSFLAQLYTMVAPCSVDITFLSSNQMDSGTSSTTIRYELMRSMVSSRLSRSPPQVIEVNKAIVLKQNAYMLFFRRIYTPDQVAQQEEALRQQRPADEVSLGSKSELSQHHGKGKNQKRRNKKKKAPQQVDTQPHGASAPAQQDSSEAAPSTSETGQ